MGGGIDEEPCPLEISPVEVVAEIGVSPGPFTLFAEILGLPSDDVAVVDVDEVVCMVVGWEARVVRAELALAGIGRLEVELELEVDVDMEVEANVVVASSMAIDVFIS